MFCSTKIRKSPVPIKFFLVFSPVPRSMRLLAKKTSWRSANRKTEIHDVYN